MTVANAPRWAQELLSNARVGHLALLDEGDHPRVLPVTFALIGDTAWSAIDQKPKGPREPARVARLRRRPEASLVVDLYEEDWRRLAWVQAIGRVAVVEIGERPEAAAALRKKYSQYREDPPPGPLLGLQVERVLSWRAFEPG